MKKTIFALVLLCASFTATFASAVQLADFTLDSLYETMNKAAEGTEFTFNKDSAVDICEPDGCLSMLTEVGVEGLGYIVYYDEKSKKVMSTGMTAHLKYPDLVLMAQAHLTAADYAGVLLKAIDPLVTEEEIDKILSQVGVYSEALLDGEPQTMEYKNVLLAGALVEDAYMLTVFPKQ